jgi:hypothetical protein
VVELEQLLVVTQVVVEELEVLELLQQLIQ